MRALLQIQCFYVVMFWIFNYICSSNLVSVFKSLMSICIVNTLVVNKVNCNVNSLKEAKSTSEMLKMEVQVSQLRNNLPEDVFQTAQAGFIVDVSESASYPHTATTTVPMAVQRELQLVKLRLEKLEVTSMHLLPSQKSKSCISQSANGPCGCLCTEINLHL